MNTNTLAPDKTKVLHHHSSASSVRLDRRLKLLRLQIQEAEILLKLADEGNVIRKTEGGWEICYKTPCDF